jgi:small-conductance mechanosensitive channel
MKAVAYGFILDQNSYLQESWSQLDFFIVVTSWIDVAVTGVDLTFVKILRLLRTLRPLRFITHNMNMKIVVTALLESVSGIINVVIVVLLVWIMFAIFGINIMKGKMYYCKFPDSSTQHSIYGIGAD